jgi:homoaconitase/3-isopropylmalate dehydratase large subunit
LARASEINLAQVGLELNGARCNSIISGLATVANMGAELGATTSTFPYMKSMHDYLCATGRREVAVAADRANASGLLAADPEVEYDQVIEIVRLLLRSPQDLEFSPSRTYLSWSRC